MILVRESRHLERERDLSTLTLEAPFKMNVQVLTLGPKMVPHKSVIKVSYINFFFSLALHQIFSTTSDLTIDIKILCFYALSIIPFCSIFFSAFSVRVAEMFYLPFFRGGYWGQIQLLWAKATIFFSMR